MNYLTSDFYFFAYKTSLKTCYIQLIYSILSPRNDGTGIPLEGSYHSELLVDYSYISNFKFIHSIN